MKTLHSSQKQFTTVPITAAITANSNSFVKNDTSPAMTTRILINIATGIIILGRPLKAGAPMARFFDCDLIVYPIFHTISHAAHNHCYLSRLVGNLSLGFSFFNILKAKFSLSSAKVNNNDPTFIDTVIQVKNPNHQSPI